MSLLLAPVESVGAWQKCDQDIVITIERQGCFGDCPIYSAKIYADGTVVYKGVRFVKEIGERRSRISQKRLQELIGEFEKIKYFSLKDEYRYDENGMSATDQETTITSLCIKGKKKQVVDYMFTPKELIALEDKIDSLAGLYKFLGPL